MRRFYRLLEDMTIQDRWHVGDMSDGADEVSDDLWSGRTWNKGGVLKAEVTHTGSRLEFFFTSFNVPIAKVKLAEAVARVAESDLQRMPVLIDSEIGYEVLNAVRVVECVDEKRSEFIKWTKDDHRSDLAGQYRSVPRLRLDTNLVPEDAQLFRIKDWEVALIVSEEVKTAMEDAGCFGARFELVTA